MNIIPEIAKRFSPTTFTNEAVSEEQMHALFTAAGRAASAFNEQPWRFVYALKEDESAFNKLLDCLVEGNRAWAKDAAVLVITTAKKTYSKNITIRLCKF